MRGETACERRLLVKASHAGTSPAPRPPRAIAIGVVRGFARGTSPMRTGIRAPEQLLALRGLAGNRSARDAE